MNHYHRNIVSPISTTIMQLFTQSAVFGWLLLFIKLQLLSKTYVTCFWQVLARIQQLSVSADISSGILITGHMHMDI